MLSAVGTVNKKERYKKWCSENIERKRFLNRKSRIKCEALLSIEKKEIIRKKRLDNSRIRENTEEIKMTRKIYRLANKDAELKRKREWVKNNLDKVYSYFDKRRKKYPFERLIIKSRVRSKSSAVENNLTLQWARARWTGRCELTGAEFIWLPGKQNAFSASLDRIDSAKGYTQDNCRFILWAINRLKGDESDEVMRKIARLIVGH